MNKIFDEEDQKYLDDGALEIKDTLDDLDENLNLFEYLNDAHVLYIDPENYYIEKELLGNHGYVYSVFTPEDYLIYRWQSFHDYEKVKDFKRTVCYKIMQNAIKDYKQEIGDDYPEDDDFWLDYDYEKTPNTDHWKIVDVDTSEKPGGSIFSRSFNYWPPIKKQKGYLEKLCNSDTLVFHRNDPSTRMLCQVYEGKGWDILTTPCNQIDDEELKELFARHDRLVFLGHGTAFGLIGMFGSEVAPYMKDKKIFAIWCNADKYFEKNGIGQGQFVTGNMPSEVIESVWAGCGKISAGLMLENITYWSKLCADKVEDCLNGNVKASVDYIRKDYLEKYGNHPVTIYNAIRTQCLGNPQPLPAYEFKGKPLEPKDYPIENFDEEAFLKNPTADASKCPTKISD